MSRKKKSRKELSRSGTVVVVGASGYGNIGDELYPLILRRHLRGCTLQFRNSDPPRRLPADAKLLVMGPGGVIYENATAHFAYMAEYMDEAMARKIPIVFLSCGVQTEAIPNWKKYLDYADLVTVRSQRDVEIIRAVTDNPNVYDFPDLGYAFTETEVVPDLPERYTVFIPVSWNRGDSQWSKIYRDTPAAERVLLRMGSGRDTELIYQSWLELGEAKMLLDVTPAMVQYVISRAQMVYTGRYHGLVLARRNGVPVQTGIARQLKLKNEDRSRDTAGASQHLVKLLEVLRRHVRLREPRVAIIHEDFSLSGGGEKLVSIAAEALGARGIHAEVYTFDISEQTRRMVSRDIKIHTLRPKNLPSADDALKRYLFSELAIEDQYDFFIFSGHAAQCAARRHKPNLLYAHNIPKSEPSFPRAHPRQLLGEEDPEELLVRNPDDVQVYLRKSKEINVLERWWRRLVVIKNRHTKRQVLPDFLARKVDALRFLLNRGLRGRKALKFLAYQSTNRENLSHIERIFTNSRNIQVKLKSKYGRDSEVVYPPIETDRYRHERVGNFWLSINRLVPLKRVEMQLEAFSRLPDEQLVILGAPQDEEYYRYLLSKKPANVTFLGVVDDAKKEELLATCRGFVFTAEDEDFGMSVVEAMASGKPVIVPDEGGCRETVVDGEHGARIANIDEKKLRAAIIQVSADPGRYREACRRQAKKFSVDRFGDSLAAAVLEALPLASQNQTSAE